MATQTIYTNNDCFGYESAPTETRDTSILQIRGRSGYRRRSYIGFDITSAPAASLVTDVKIYLRVAYFNEYEDPTTARFNRITSTAWDESTLTWNNMDSQAPVTATNQITHYIGNPTVGWYNYSVTNLYKDAKNAGNEFGMRMMDHNEYGDTSIQWGSKETAYDPYIIITYTPSDHYYVKVGGNDSLDGQSWANAWATVNKAATTVADGKTVHIGFGSYVLEPATNKIAPQNVGATGITYHCETATTGGGTGTVSVEQNA